MATIFATLPAPAANGSGAAVDMSAFGAEKTITVSRSGGVVEPIVVIEISNDVGGTKWAPLWTFGIPGERTFAVACRWMRATVQNYRGGAAPAVEVGGEDVGTQFLSLAVPTGNGIGTPASSNTLPMFKTVVVGGAFRGNLTVEISEDGGVTYSQVLSFLTPGFRTIIATAGFMRVRRNGVPLINPGLPIVNVAATIGGGGLGSIVFEESGVPLAGAPHDTLNVTGDGQTFVDSGGGVATLDIPGVTFEDEGVPVAGGPHDTLNVIGQGAAIGNLGGGVAGLVIPGVVFEEAGAPLANPPHIVLNVTGPGQTLVNSGGGVATLNISGRPSQTKRYVAVGGESDFNVVLTTPLATDVYTVVATCAGVAIIVGIDCPDLLAGDRTTTQFRVITTLALTAGDQIDFNITS